MTAAGTANAGEAFAKLALPRIRTQFALYGARERRGVGFAGVGQERLEKPARSSRPARHPRRTKRKRGFRCRSAACSSPESWR